MFLISYNCLAHLQYVRQPDPLPDTVTHPTSGLPVSRPFEADEEDSEEDSEGESGESDEYPSEKKLRRRARTLAILEDADPTRPLQREHKPGHNPGHKDEHKPEGKGKGIDRLFKRKK